MALSVSETEIRDVTPAKDDGILTNAHIFNYNLNDRKTRKKVYEGALRVPYEREEKDGCMNMIFSDGAFNEVVLKAIIELKNGPKHFVVGKEDVERVTIDPRQELSGKHIDTKI